MSEAVRTFLAGNLVQPATHHLQGVPFHENINLNRAQKEAIGRAAAALCEPGEAVIIDGGSTTLQMCPHIASLNLQVLTNSLHIVSALLPQADTRVLVPSGTVFREQNIILGAAGEDSMPHFFAPKLFMGAAAVGPRGLMQADVVLVAAERRLIDVAEKLILLVDSSKFANPTGIVVCDLDQVDTVITDAGLTRDQRAKLEEAGNRRGHSRVNAAAIVQGEGKLVRGSQAKRFAGGLFLSVASLAAADAATPGDQLKVEFANPPAAARPRVWWHWMNGNVTKDGIAKDLAWMKRVGIGGLQNFDANLGTPQIVAKRLIYMHPDWKDAFRFTAQKADELGLELAIAASPGWSETGGPWVKPKDGLKKLVWSETDIAGGRPFSGNLAAPPSTTGPFQTLRMNDPLAGVGGGEAKAPPSYYADVAVLAYPIAQGAASPAPNAEVGGKPVDFTALADDHLETVASVPRGSRDRPTAIALTYPGATAIRSATIFVPGEVSPFNGASFTPVLEANDDGKWVKIAELPLTDVPTTVSFAPVTARQFRIVLGPSTEPQRIGLGEGAPGAATINFFPPQSPDAPVKIAELRLTGEPKIDRFESKAGFAIARDYYALSQGVPNVGGVPASQVIDVTSKMRPDGTLDWTPPAGRWRVLRLGYSLLGTTNHPATPEATGLEVDKYDASAVRNYLETYFGCIRMHPVA